MQSLQDNKANHSASIAKPPSFSPFLRNTLKHPNNEPIDYVLISYSQKQNMIITSCLDDTLRFYDVTTLLPLEERKQKLKASVTTLSSDENYENFIIGSHSGIYIYNIPNNKLKKLQESGGHIFAAQFLSPSFYVFSVFESKRFSIGSFNGHRTHNFGLKSSDAVSLCHFSKKNLLFSGLRNGSLLVCRTNKLPKLKKFCSVRGYEPEISRIKIQKMGINRKEYVLTSSEDSLIKIWHFNKGRLRLLRVIYVKEVIDSFVYLESYKMIGVACDGSNEIKFFNVFSGKLEKTFGFSGGEICSLFLMKDKNLIGGIGGVSGLHNDYIEFVQF